MNRLALLVTASVFYSGSQAALLDITNIEGGWSDATPVSINGNINNVDGQGTDEVRWGLSATSSGQSGYDFTPGSDLFDISIGTNFHLGTFTHLNNPIYTPWDAPSLETINYDFGFETNGTPGSLSTSFSFTHDETLNSIDNCPLGSISTCDDYVDIANTTLNQLINVDGDSYYFNLLGFSTDGGNTFSSSFQSPELGSNSADLYGIVTAYAVPEPGTIALFGLGALLIGGVARKKV